MLLLGFGAALRRSELVGLALGDVECVPDKGLLLTIGRSKTDQHGAGQRVAVWANPKEPGFCPAAALDAWLAHRRTAADLDWTASAASRAARPLFCAITKAARSPGPNCPTTPWRACSSRPPPTPGSTRKNSPATRCSDNHARLADLMRQSRHRSAQTVLGYIEPADLWRNNVTEGVFRGNRPATEAS